MSLVFLFDLFCLGLPWWDLPPGRSHLKWSCRFLKINHQGNRKAEEAQAAQAGTLAWWVGGSVQLPKGSILLGLGLVGAEELAF